jgi:hypothetical protein
MVFIVLSKYRELTPQSRDCSAEVDNRSSTFRVTLEKKKNAPLAFTKILQRLVCGHA